MNSPTLMSTTAPKKRISVQAAKAKGRKLQQAVVRTILDRFPELTERDVASCPMGSQGEDVILSEAASKRLRISIECKARNGLKSLYDWYDQAATNAKGNEPVLIVKRDRRAPLALVDLNFLIQLLGERK